MQITIKEQKFKARWAKTKARGKIRYIAIYTVALAIIYSLISYLLIFVWPPQDGVYDSEDFINDLFVGAVVGLILSMQNWRTNERRMLLVEEKLEKKIE